MSRKVTVQIEVCEENAEGPTEWFPSIDKASALILLDEQIRRVRGSLQSLKEMRAAIEAAPVRSTGEKP